MSVVFSSFIGVLKVLFVQAIQVLIRDPERDLIFGHKHLLWRSIQHYFTRTLPS